MHQGWDELRQDRQLIAPALGRFRFAFEQRQGAVEMLDCFAVGRAQHRPLASVTPIADGARCVAGILQMMGHDLRRASRFCREQRVGDAAVQEATPLAQQAAIRSILHQRVLEEKGSPRRRTALKHQPRRDKARECVLQRVQIARIGRGKQLERKFAANRSADLCHFASACAEPATRS